MPESAGWPGNLDCGHIMGPTRRPSYVVALDDGDDPSDVIDSMALEEFIAGTEPFARTTYLTRVRPDATLLPPNAEAMRTAVFDNYRAVLARGEGWTVKSERWSDKTAQVTVSAISEELLDRQIRAATDGASLPALRDERTSPVGFWHHQNTGPKRTARDVAVEPWVAIRQNYSTPVALSLDSLMGIDPVQLDGRLILLHGPPGTGKTTALRSLALAWKRWCKLEVVLDPERLLVDPAYLMGVILDERSDDGENEENEADNEAVDEQPDDEAGKPDEDHGGTAVERTVSGQQDVPRGKRWRLLVLEDCDELIRADAKNGGAGQSLARLLNLTDGFLGQGLNVMVAMTTNEPISQLHPAIVREGRCLAEIYVGRLSRSEAVAWLGGGDASRIGPDGATLAELVACRRQRPKVQQKPKAASIGQYL